MAVKKILITKRELEIIKLIAEGLTDLEIAKELKLSYNAIRLYINNSTLKLGATNRTNLIHVAHQKGVIK